MRLILHLGAYGTDDGVIAAWMAQNRETFAQQGLCAPVPRAFVQAISGALGDQVTDPKTREEAVLRGLGASGSRRWMAVSAPGLLGSKADCITPDGFYGRDVARRLYGLSTLFPRCEVTCLLAIRRASGLLPRVLPQATEALAESLSQIGAETLPWAHLVRTIRRHLPRARLIVWRHEDFADVWPQVLAVMAGPLANAPPAGLMTLAAQGLSAEARLRLERYCATNPPATVGQLRRLGQVFAQQYGRSAALAAEAELPVWALREFDRLDRGYRTEWHDIAGQAGVTVLGDLASAGDAD